MPPNWPDLERCRITERKHQRRQDQQGAVERNPGKAMGLLTRLRSLNAGAYPQNLRARSASIASTESRKMT
jgi:hypothetical protein